MVATMARKNPLSNRTGRSDDLDDHATTIRTVVGAIRPTDRVKIVQSQLQLLGYDIGKYGVDGIYGPDTMMAVAKFQKDEGLRSNGILTPETEERLAVRTVGSEIPGYGTLESGQGPRSSLAEMPGLPSSVSPSDLKNLLGLGLDPTKFPGGVDPTKFPGGVDPAKFPGGIDPTKLPGGIDPSKLPGGGGVVVAPSTPVAPTEKKPMKILGMTPMQAGIVGGVGILSIGLIVWGMSSPSRS